ncbi:MAG: hypothetical protein HQM11_02735 [SAR324 cluster bacterium]|nr:hypothetical protein [SAR324 cluster bacterium]
MDIAVLDKESLMVLITQKSVMNGSSVDELAKDIFILKEKGAMGFIFDFSATPFISENAIAFLATLGAEAIMGNDILRFVCDNPKVLLQFEISGMSPYIQPFQNAQQAIEDMKQALFIEGDLLNPPQMYKTASTEFKLAGLGQAAKSAEPTFVQPGAEVSAGNKMPPSSAKPDEELPFEFQFQDLKPEELSNPYMLDSAENSEDALKGVLKHLTFKMKDSYGQLQETGRMVLGVESEFIAKHAYPVREWARSFLVTQGTSPKMRHLLLTLGGYAHKKAKSLSYSASQALDEYELECYFSIAIYEPCQLYGPTSGNRQAKGMTFLQYSYREPALQKFLFKILPKLKLYVRQQEQPATA